MGSHTVLTGDKEQERPCDTCRLHAACAAHRLACRAYFHWMSYGRAMKPEGLPTRAYFDALAAESAADSGRQYGLAKAEETRLIRRAKMRRICRTHTRKEA